MSVVLENHQSSLTKTIRQGELWYADLGEPYGSEQAGRRIVLIFQNDTGNLYSPTTIVIPLTSANKKRMPTHIYLNAEKFRLKKDSIILGEQIRVCDKGRLIDKVSEIDDETMDLVDKCLSVNFYRFRRK